MKRYLIFLIVFYSFSSFSQLNTDDSPTYPDLIDYYKVIAEKHQEVQLFEMGQSDYGLPIYLCLINAGEDSLSSFNKARNETTVLINNAIHAGEPDGINACIQWVNDWIENGKKKTPIIAIIPAYNVGGMMNRSSVSRANQNGPNEYGFRGNAQNLDLNRDFIKMDSKNMFTFATIYHALDPDVFIDTHVSNGADYQYVMTFIAPVKERMAPSITSLQHGSLIPFLENKFRENKIPFSPYVNLIEDVPEKGFSVFNDLPRYAMGYASLFNSISFTTETHMLKPFQERVKSTYVFIDEVVKWSSKNSKRIENARSKAFVWDKDQTEFKYNYQLSLTDSILVDFTGYEHEYVKSRVTGLVRLRYLKDKPYSKSIPYFNKYTSTSTMKIPKYFIIKGQCDEIVNRLKANNVRLTLIEEIDTIQGLNQFEIMKFKSGAKPYEGHFLHNSVDMQFLKSKSEVKSGDYVLAMNQKNRRFIMNVLTPNAPDSYFAWNFLDSYVQQKEYFSPYVFEEKAEEILLRNTELRNRFELKKLESDEFANSSWSQLYFIYKNSKLFEPSYNQLPIYMKF